MKKYLFILAILSQMLFTQSCVKKIQGIRLVSYRVTQVIPEGLRAVNVKGIIEVDNPAMQLTLEDVRVQAYRMGVKLGTVTAEPLTLKARSITTYDVAGRLELAPYVSILQLYAYAGNFRPDEYTIDLAVKVKLKGGGAVKINKKDIPLTRFLSTDKK